MKDEKLKTCESQNSLKGKSTFDNSKISERIKSTKNSKKNIENPLPKKGKKIIIFKKVTKIEKNKTTEKLVKPKLKEDNINKKINNYKLIKTSTRTKIPNKIIDKSNIKDKSGKTPRPIKDNKKINKSILTMSSLPRIKETQNLNSKRTNKNNNKNNKTNNNITTYKKTFSTISHKNIKSTKINRQKNNEKKEQNNKSDYSSEELDEISLDITPQLITDKMYKKETLKTSKTLGNKNMGNNVNNKPTLRKNIISLSKNKNQKNFFIDVNSKMNHTFINKTLNVSCSNKNKNNNSSRKPTLNISVEKNYPVNNKNKKRNKEKPKYIETEINNDKNKEKNKNKILNGSDSKYNYLKFTISAINKMVKKKINSRTNNNSISSRPFFDKDFDQKNKSISKKETKNKLKKIFILRNTISRYKLYNKNNLFLLDDKPLKDSIKSPKSPKSPTLSKYSTLHNSTKNYFNLIDNYKMIKSLGKGSYGEVKLAIDKITREKYAIKIYPKKILDDPKKRKNIENEIKILKQLDNINIMKLHEVIKTDKFKYLILEYIEGISLLEIIKKEKKHYLEEKRALKIFIQIVKAIEYCQSKNICHRDIKLENILTLKDDVIKIIDFGFAVKTNKETYQTLLCGSPSYMAPEIVKKEKYIAQYSDIWSLGVLLFSMLFGRFPFKGKTQEELFENIKKCEVKFPEEIKVSDEIKILFKKIFVNTPTQRPSLNEILNDVSLIID